jgi:hypothetical protein
MQILVIFGHPHFKATIEEGLTEKHCIQKALNKFNEEFLGGGSLDDAIHTYSNKNAGKPEKEWQFPFQDYIWAVLTYDNNTLKESANILQEIFSDIQTITINKTKELIRKNKTEQYNKLKEELGLLETLSIPRRRKI